MIRDDDFRNLYSHIYKKGGGTYKNSRNAVAGIMGLKEIDEMIAQKAKITLVDYNMVSFRVRLSELADRWEGLLAELAALPYPQDGVVLKLADTAYEASLGSTAHHPRGQIAYKFTNIRRTTKLLDVEWSFGKNCLTPVAHLEPVEISGTTIKRATLHNVQNILELGIEIGDTVTVERAGDVIPYIVSSEPGAERVRRSSKTARAAEPGSCGAAPSSAARIRTASKPSCSASRPRSATSASNGSENRRCANSWRTPA